MTSKRRKVTSKADTSVLFHRLRLEAQKNDLVVYNVLVRNAGIGFSYASSSNEWDGAATVFCYHKGSLRNAVVRELERWREKK